jgi:hypothetical protein
MLTSTISFEDHVERAYAEIAGSVFVDGPFDAGTHRTYVVRGLAETPEQMENLSWCILSFLDHINEVECKLESRIGVGKIASRNLVEALGRKLDIGITPEPSPESKDRKRNALLAEIISHVLVFLHRRKIIFPDWIGNLSGCKKSHLNVNDAGIDLVAIGFLNPNFIPIIGEVKAYADRPVEGFEKACEKFTEVRAGKYNADLREDYTNLSINNQLSKDELANNIWQKRNRFGAFVNFDNSHDFDKTARINREEILRQTSDRLFLILTPHTNMRNLFESISDKLLQLAKTLGESND